MGTVTVLRALSRRRRSVRVAAVLALLVGAAVFFKLPSLQTRAYTVGKANVNILLDTPSSQVVEVAPKGSDTLGVRATLLANLMVDGVVKTSIAQAAGINPNDLAGISNVGPDPTQTGPTNPRAPQISTNVVTDANGLDLPIIEVAVQSGDAAAAARLANASVTGLRTYLASKAAEERIPDAQRLEVSGLGLPVGTDSSQGPGVVMALVATIFVFCLGCGGILGVAAVRRNWRAASEAEVNAAEPTAAPLVTANDAEDPALDWVPRFSPSSLGSRAAQATTTPQGTTEAAVPIGNAAPAHHHEMTVNGWGGHVESEAADGSLVQEEPDPAEPKAASRTQPDARGVRARRRRVPRSGRS